MPPKDACPCGSGRPYKACCEPFHRGRREPPDAEALMRSRFAAFAKKEAAYLVRTLHPDHEDRALDEALLVKQLRASASEFRYAGLAILDKAPPDDAGIARVLFLARVFRKSTELSFVELSDFAHDGAGWRYLRGANMQVAAIKGDPLELRIPTFEALPTPRRPPRA